MNRDKGFKRQAGFEKERKAVKYAASQPSLSIYISGAGGLIVVFEVSSQNIRHTHVQMQVQNTSQSQRKMTVGYYFPFCEK